MMRKVFMTILYSILALLFSGGFFLMFSPQFGDPPNQKKSLFYEKYDHLDTVWDSSAMVSGFKELYELLGSVKDFNSLNRACELEMGVLNVSVIDAVFKSNLQDGKTICL